jgi:ClpP class serine protease
MDGFGWIWWIFILYSLLMPWVGRRSLDMRRVQLMRRLQKRRQSRVITLIHRQESMSFLGIPLARYINIEDSEQVLRAIRLTPPGLALDLILHTPGGLVLAAEQIASALARHEGKVTVFVPHYAMSGGTMLALAADEICMDENAVLGPVDPQIGEYPAASIVRVLEQKPLEHVDDKTLILADVARKARVQVRSFMEELLGPRLGGDKAAALADALTEGHWTHDYPITVDRLRQLGVDVCVGLPPEIYTLMELYPQPPGRRPSVEYVPMP